MDVAKFKRNTNQNETSRRGPAGDPLQGLVGGDHRRLPDCGVDQGQFLPSLQEKEELALAAASLFAQAPYRALPDPLDRLLGYVDFRRSILKGSLPEYTCLLD
jgi:hypothetical protein